MYQRAQEQCAAPSFDGDGRQPTAPAAEEEDVVDAEVVDEGK